MYRSLNADRIIATAEQLRNRITERFPGSGLGKVADELLSETQQAAETARWLAAPLRWVRVVSGVTILLLLAVASGAFFALNRKVELFSSVSDFLQGVDAGVNEIILIGVATYFLVGWESRRKRSRALRAIHVLRSMAHIIDMHQLTKDPERLSAAGLDTLSSPRRKMSRFELTRYFDYCAEMLSILSKIAALYVQEFNDPVTLSAVDEVQDLTGGLSQKIWQKNMILDRVTAAD